MYQAENVTRMTYFRRCIASLCLLPMIATGVSAAEKGTTIPTESKMTYVLDKDGLVPQPVVAIDQVCAWPNLTQLPDGTIIALIHNQPSHGQMPGDVDCWASEDEGKTWVKRSVAAPRETPEQNRMNVAAGLTAQGDLILITAGWSEPGNPDADGAPLLGHTLQPWVCISADAGRTWTIDKTSFPKGPDGRTLVPFGDIMTGKDGKLRVAAYRGPDDEAAQAAAKEKGDVLLKRASKGQNWVIRGDGHSWDEELVRITHRSRRNETAIFHLGDGKWIAAARKSGLTLGKSDDDAKTWTLGEKLTEGSCHPGHLTRLKDGTIMLTYGNRQKPADGHVNGQGVDVKFSNDEGATWGKPFRLVDLGTGDSGYPSSVQLSDGRVLTVYYEGWNKARKYSMGSIIWDPAKTREQSQP
jgi:hypothetical protein